MFIYCRYFIITMWIKIQNITLKYQNYNANQTEFRTSNFLLRCYLKTSSFQESLICSLNLCRYSLEDRIHIYLLSLLSALYEILHI